MGKLITFWSPVAGRAGTTSVMGAMAAAIAMLYPEQEVALCHMQKESRELIQRMESRGYAEGKTEWLEKIGLNALALQYMQSELNREKIRKCAIPLQLKSLFLYPAYGRKDALEEVYEKLLKEKMTEVFDFVFLDLDSGDAKGALHYMKEADVSVLVLPQEEACWQLYEEQYKRQFQEKNVCIVLGRYKKESRYNEAYFKKRRYRMGGEYIGTIPDCVGYMDAMAEGRTLEFFLRNQMVGKKEANYEFMEQTRQTAMRFKELVDRRQGHKLQFFRTMHDDVSDAGRVHGTESL